MAETTIATTTVQLPPEQDCPIETQVTSATGAMTGDVPTEGFASGHERAEQTPADARPATSGEHSRLPEVPQEAVDFPAAPSLTNTDEFTWDENKPPVENYVGIGKALAQAGDLFRSSTYAGGLVLASRHPNVPPMSVNDAGSLLPVILDRLRVNVVSGGKPMGRTIRAVHLRTMLKSEAFLQQFRPVDEVIDRPMYLEPDFRLTCPGYNDGGLGCRFLHVGPPATVADGRDAIERFLEVMAFESDADRANTFAACLTVLLRNFWPGAKPIVVVTANKSHAGKETLINCIAGLTPMIAVSYQPTNWAFERSFVGAIRHDPKVGVISIDNARLEGARFIRSAFLERFLTDAQPFLFSTGTGRPVCLWNNFVVTMSTNEGSLSSDLMNRSLPIHLAPRGDVTRRHSPIGNPKHDYLPRHREQIEAELHGMIANWHEAGRPLATDIGHPFTPWAQTIGGILRVNGIEQFLANFETRRSVDDPVRRALGLLGAAKPGAWLRASEWSEIVLELGLVRPLIPEADRDSNKARARGTGVTLSAHIDEIFDVDTEDNLFEFQLEKLRKRFPGDKEPMTKYRFRALRKRELPEDDGHDD
jgi:hypothetical protein